MNRSPTLQAQVPLNTMEVSRENIGQYLLHKMRKG